MPEHIMIDLETLGTSSNAAILSIGAVRFDTSQPLDHLITDSFEVHIDPVDCQRSGMDIDVDTVLWWMQASRTEAREELLSHQYSWLDLTGALDAFHVWFGEHSLPTWGNGATFDNVILRNAYERCNMEAPWNFWDDRCHRTFKSLAPEIKPDRTGTHHSARHDAIYQAQQLKQVADHLGIAL